MHKKPIRQSNLLLRFYVADGWNKEELDDCTAAGEVKIHTESDPMQYFILFPGKFNIGKLLEIGYIERESLERIAPERLKLTDEEILTRMNF